MPTTTETVTLDRGAVVDLLVEIHAVTDVLEAITGVDSPRINRGLTLAADRISKHVLPDLDDDVGETFCEAADEKAREIVSWLAKPKEEILG